MSSSQRTDLAGLRDTQIIEKVPSQTLRLRGLRILGSNEENRIVDSSVDDREVDSQLLAEMERDTVFISEPKALDLSNGSHTNGKSQDSSAPFKNLKLPNADSPWLSRIADPFEDTPEINKIRNFRETPVHSRTTHTETPNTLSKRVVDTPSDHAHKIFDHLRDQQAQPELEVDTQPIPSLIPSLGFDTQDRTPHKSMDFDAHHRTRHWSQRLETQDDTPQGMRSTINDDLSAPDISVEEDTIADADNSNSLIASGDHASLQIPGTAPDAGMFEETRELINLSSPVMSDDDEEHSKNDSSSEPNAFQAEDSLQVKRDRDLSMKSSPLPRTEDSSSWPQPPSLKSISFPAFKGSLPQRSSCHVETPSKAFLACDTPSKMTPGERETIFVASSPSLKMVERTPQKDVPSDLETKPAQEQSQTDVNYEIPVDVTQELSDIDDVSHVDATIDEEDPSVLELPQEEEDRVYRPTRQRKRTRQAISSQEMREESKKVDPRDRSRDVTPPSSELFILGSQQRPELPNGILTEDKLLFYESDVMFKSGIWYLYQTHYYPGIIIGDAFHGHLVKFNDREQTVSGVLPLDIRIGDQVFQYNEGTPLRIIGLECTSESDDTIRCMRGYDTLIVQPVKRRKNIASQRIALQDIKMTVEEYLKVDRIGSSREVTRRRSPLKPVVKEEITTEGLKNTQVNVKSQLFAGCIFALTDLDERKKLELELTILENGGKIAEDGFEEFMKFSYDKFALTPRNTSLNGCHFAALITSRTNRFPKFFECLSLGWPVLRYEFVEHCVCEKELLKNIRSYLLPAGISMNLQDSITSADISDFLQLWSSGLSLEHQLSNNRLLAGRVVLMSDSNPRVSDFLFHALGAETRLVNLSKSNKLLEECEDETRVYLYGKDITGLERRLTSFDRGLKTIAELEARPKKMTKSRKRRAVEFELIDWEWLVQCIISKHPWKSTKVTVS